MQKESLSLNTQKEGAGKSRTGKHTVQPKKKRRVRKKAIFVVVCVFLILICGGLAMASMSIKPPSVVKPSTDDVDTPQEEREDGIYNVLVVGTDKVGLNTDTILVLSLDSINNRANVMSIPRDTMSNVTRSVKKINAAYAIGAKKGKGNIDNLKKEVSYLLGFEVDNYVVVNLGAFEEIIDAIGGVTIDVPRNMNYDDPYQDLHIHLNKGLQTLNGEQAIGFVRYRSGYAEGDLGRVKAQQTFIQAVAKQLASPTTITKIPKLTEIVLRNMDTDLTNGEMVWFAKEAVNINMETDLQMFVLPGEARYVNSLSYYLPNEEEILEIVNQYFNPYATPIKSLNIVNVSNIVQKENARQSSLTTEQRKKEEKLKEKVESEASVDNEDLLKEQADGQTNPAGDNQNSNNSNSSNSNSSNNNSSSNTEPGTDQQPVVDPTTPPTTTEPSGTQPPATDQTNGQVNNNTNNDSNSNNGSNTTDTPASGTDSSGYNTAPGEVLKPDAGSETSTAPTDSAA